VAGVRFRLDRVLEWRKTQLDLAEASFKQESAALAELDRLLLDCDAAAVRAQSQVRSWASPTGADLAALDAFRLHLRARKAELARRRAAQFQTLKEREAAMLEARRRCRLLERLKERRAAEWAAEENRALEAAAAESYLAKWSRRTRKAEEPAA